MNARRVLMPTLMALALAGCGGDDDSCDRGPGSALVRRFRTRDVNERDPATLRQGGELRLAIADFAENWNPLHVDGNDGTYALVRQSLLPRFFDFDAAGVRTPNPDYVTSVEVVSEDPTVVRYQLNPDAVWGDGSPVDGDDMRAMWQACNGERPDFRCVSTQSYESIESIETGDDATDVTVTYATPFPDWSQGIHRRAEGREHRRCRCVQRGLEDARQRLAVRPVPLRRLRRDAEGHDAGTERALVGFGAAAGAGSCGAASRPEARAQAFANDEIDAFDIALDPDAYQRAAQVERAEVRQAGGPDFRHFTFNSKAGLLQELPDPAGHRALAGPGGHRGERPRGHRLARRRAEQPRVPAGPGRLRRHRPGDGPRP